MSSFFTLPGGQKKRKRTEATDAPKKRFAPSKTPGKTASRPAPPPKAKKKREEREERDESISGSESDFSDDDAGAPLQNGDEDSSDDSDKEGETAAERRLRLAERYLDNVRQEVNDDEYAFDAEEIDRDLIAERLKEDVAEGKGKIYKKLAPELAFDKASHTQWKWNSQIVSAVAVCAPYAYTVSHDGYLTKWRIQDLPQHQWPQTTKKKPKKPPAPPKRVPQRVVYRRGNPSKAQDETYDGHVGAILTVAASQDGKFVVTGGADRRIVVYDAETLKPLRCFRHHRHHHRGKHQNYHRDAVTGLAFRRGTNQLYSCSRDRTIKVWSLDELAHIETLYGHEDHIVDIDALAQDRCVTVGARDRTARLWKVVEETQLVFRGGGAADKEKRPPAGVDPRSLAHEGSIDRVAMIDDELFVTGADNGSISLWSLQKKKPLFVQPRAHGVDPPLDAAVASAEKNPDLAIAVPPPQPRWITALRTIPYTDVILSGSWDGYVRAWKLSDDKRRLEPLGVLGPEVEAEAEAQKPALNGANGVHKQAEGVNRIRGVINDIATFERGERGKDGLCVVAVFGKQHRLGSWKEIDTGRNGAVVFEVAKIPKAATNGVHGSSDDEDD